MFFDKLAESLNIQKPEDWYKVRAATVIAKGGTFVGAMYNTSLIRGMALKVHSY
jgi:hypothetical protein